MADPKLDELVFRASTAASVDPVARLRERMLAGGIVKVAGGGGDGGLGPGPVAIPGIPFAGGPAQRAQGFQAGQGVHVPAQALPTANSLQGTTAGVQMLPARTIRVQGLLQPRSLAQMPGLIPKSPHPADSTKWVLDHIARQDFVSEDASVRLAADGFQSPPNPVAAPAPPPGSLSVSERQQALRLGILLPDTGRALDVTRPLATEQPLSSLRADLLRPSADPISALMRHVTGALVLRPVPLPGPLFDEPPPSGDSGAEMPDGPCRDLRDKADPRRGIPREALKILDAKLTGTAGDEEALKSIRGLIRRDPAAALKGIAKARKDVAGVFGEDSLDPASKRAREQTLKLLDELEEFARIDEWLLSTLITLDRAVADVADSMTGPRKPCPEILDSIGSYLSGQFGKGNCQLLKSHVDLLVDRLKSLSFGPASAWASLQKELTQLAGTLAKCPPPADKRALAGVLLAEFYRKYRAYP